MPSRLLAVIVHNLIDHELEIGNNRFRFFLALCGYDRTGHLPECFHRGERSHKLPRREHITPAINANIMQFQCFMAIRNTLSGYQTHTIPPSPVIIKSPLRTIQRIEIQICRFTEKLLFPHHRLAFLRAGCIGFDLSGLVKLGLLPDGNDTVQPV